MSTFQIVMLVGAGALAISIFWPQILALLDNWVELKNAPKIGPEPEPDPKPIPPLDDAAHKTSELVNIIACWEILKKNCAQAGMDEAVAELNKIFPLFAIVNPAKAKAFTEGFAKEYISLTDNRGGVKNV